MTGNERLAAYVTKWGVPENLDKIRGQMLRAGLTAEDYRRWRNLRLRAIRALVEKCERESAVETQHQRCIRLGREADERAILHNEAIEDCRRAGTHSASEYVGQSVGYGHGAAIALATV